MRITNLLAICLLSTAACVAEPGRGFSHGPDAGSKDGATEVTCNEMTSVTGDKYIDSGDVIDGVPDTCWTLSGKLTIRGSITSIDKLGDLRSVGSLVIDGTQLTTLGTRTAFSVNGSIQVTGNTLLTSLDKVTATNPAAVTIDTNAVLRSLGGLADIETITGDLTITNNPMLNDVTLRSLTSVANNQITQTISISNNAALTTINTPSLTAINRLLISNNPSLTSVSSLQATVVGNIEISNNKLLASLGSMSSLTTVTDSFKLDSNPVLANLDMFTTNMKTIAGQLIITNNVKLNAQMGEPLSHLTRIGAITITGNTTLNGCAAREIDACVQTDENSNIGNNHQQNNCNSWCGH